MSPNYLLSIKNVNYQRLGINSEPSTPPNEPVESVVIAPQRRDPSQLVQRLQNHSRRSRLGIRKTRRAEMALEFRDFWEEGEEDDFEITFVSFCPKKKSRHRHSLAICMYYWPYALVCSGTEVDEYLELNTR
ncbi:unnamed protein product, partial [Meganyctiphanes norvegica]